MDPEMETLPSRELDLVGKKDTDENADVASSRIKIEHIEDKWNNCNSDNKEDIHLEIENKCPMSTNIEEVQAAVALEHHFVKSENDESIEDTTVLNRIKSEDNDWDEFDASKVGDDERLAMKIDSEVKEELIVKGEADENPYTITEADLKRIKKESSENYLDEHATHDTAIKPETDMDSEDFKVTEITEEFNIKTDSDASMDAVEDMASNSMQKSIIPRNHHEVQSKKADRESFSCYDCSKTVYSKYDLINHLKVHDNQTDVSTQDAHLNKIDGDTPTLWHLKKAKTASSNKVYTCVYRDDDNQCNAIFNRKSALDDHVVKKHPNVIKSVTNKIYECTECVYKTTYKYNFYRHLTVHQKTASYKRIICIHCNASFNNKISLDDHIVRKHLDLTASVCKKIFECLQCSFRTVRKSYLRNHMLTHSNYKLYTCTHCDAKFKRKATLNDHTIRKHPDFATSVDSVVYECTSCPYKTTASIHIKRHMSIHSETCKLSICKHCNATFKSETTLDDHVVRKHPDSAASVGKKILECLQCSFRTVRKSNLRQHMLTHSNYKLHMCTQCDAKFKRKATLNDHIIRKHPDSATSVDRAVYECTSCAYKSTVLSQINRHNKSVHSATPQTCEVSTCKHCDATFKTKRALDGHVVEKHPEFIPSVSRKMHECKICFYKTIHAYKLNMHMSKHHETASSYELRRCVHCEATFKTKTALDLHVVKKHPAASVGKKILECLQCSFRTVRKNYLRQHILTHSNYKLYTCTHCDAKFKRKASLNDHIIKKHPDFATSVDSVVYECTSCPYKTTASIHIKRHMSVHSERALYEYVVRRHPALAASVGKKILECSQCSFRTVQKSNLRKHMLTHSNYKLYTCKHCDAKFKRNATLNDHIIRKHPDFATSVSSAVYQCTSCTYKTTVSIHIKRHMSVHSKTCKPSTCKHCNATFKTKTALNKHVVKEHPDLAASVGKNLFECSQCSFRTVQKRSLNSHIIRDHPDFTSSVDSTIYECTSCIYKTTARGYFEKHMLLHPETCKVSTCKHCNVTFKTERALDEHVVWKHPDLAALVGEKIFECSECGFRTFRKSYSDEHMLAHSNKLNTCTYCDAAFKRKTTLNDHIVREHPDFAASVDSAVYECTSCTYKSTVRSQFNRHMSVHSETPRPRKLHPCKHCNATYKTKRALDDHVVRKHPDFMSSYHQFLERYTNTESAVTQPSI